MTQQQTKHRAYVGLGANLRNPRETVNAAIHDLGMMRTSMLVSTSSLYLTAPVNADGDDFINAVVELRTELSPTELHAELKALELKFGRTRHYANAPRTLDLDLLLFDQLTMTSDTLQIPHPRLTQRAFVIFPLLEIAPEIVIPLLGKAHSFLPALQNQIITKLD